MTLAHTSAISVDISIPQACQCVARSLLATSRSLLRDTQASFDTYAGLRQGLQARGPLAVGFGVEGFRFRLGFGWV